MYGGGRGGGNGHDGYGADHGADAGPEPEGEGRKSRKGLIIGASSVLVLALIGGGIGWYVWQLPEPEEATAAFASSWEAQDYEALAETTMGDDAAQILGGIDAGLGVDAIDVNVGEPSVDGGEGSASYEVTVSLTNADDWGWEGELPLLREDGEWWIDFSPEVAYPGLGEGQVLARTAVWGERGHILAADGTRLDGPDSSGSLQMLAGSLGEADEDDVERLGPAYSVGDTIGVDGLQRTYEEHLAGEAATTIVMADAEEAQAEGSVEATEDNTVATLDGSDGEDITTSIDMDVQNTAANAIIDADDPAGLVAMRPSTGEVLAAVNVPGGFNRAFEGQYPPGSAFKIVSYSALLDNGMSTDETMDCPEEYELGGWPFRNANEAEYGSQSVTEAFATSCNTALVAELGDRLNGEQLQASAEQFGMNQPLDVGVTSHEPVFPAVDSATMLGSQGIGQGQILTSPLHMATLPSAIADGSWRHPVLVNEPEVEDLPEPRPIANAEAIRPMMRAVITDGTAEDIDFEGEVFGKTGTAEYGTAEDADDDDELPSHAWMVGYKGDVAFALVVDGGGGGSSVAGPLAADFTNGLP
ncbi:penicillin-binding protein [Nocardiopsis sp. HNM0947]|uniref:Penicillin-binding protein n=1 Tax=Nocardiopsis coralli TaxID=2772213 RepID=A0ABR9P9K1_9ACTN|nr:penicillin-binding protein [Nocardiopsis coralli]